MCPYEMEWFQKPREAEQDRLKEQTTNLSLKSADTVAEVNLDILLLSWRFCFFVI